MIDINLLRQQPDLIKTALKNRQKDPTLADKVLEFETNRREILVKVEELRSRQNVFNRSLKGKPTDEQLKELSVIKEKLKTLETDLKEIEANQNSSLEEIPNIPADDVPVGKDESENVIYKTVGEIPKFDFQPLDHADLGEKLDIIDIKKAAQISGSRFGYFKGQGAILEMAVMHYSFNKLAQKDFIGMIPPAMIKSSTEWKCGYASNKNLMGAYYSIPEDDLIFISSSEHSVVPYHMDEILDPKLFPIKYVNYSPCIDCCKTIIASGIKEVVYSEEYDDASHTIQFLRDNNVQVIKI